ncbi:hypothetical protein IMG5_115340 [Ichthyophthirius multifiliis]|uniref:Uncharacterized protein n=1 Tax=Ichthyophthirius multifiliis TaxID=5932 RepID=G0QU73_ICHMU|nr:hypothetical protein IMG5_115340 [Ichthyophthirius multifiliis]EGR31231.1 hypothetical protein IMG5_115340 [Ichthyophthirius multifiliis]|eukprot:XP_004034717.1 hypothetical protein IMG5_115340 [Ichthyophthirius multifiliis]
MDYLTKRIIQVKGNLYEQQILEFFREATYSTKGAEKLGFNYQDMIDVYNQHKIDQKQIINEKLI